MDIRLLLFLILLSPPVGCNRLTGDAYKGEKLATLKGTVHSPQKVAPPAAAQIVLVWENDQTVVYLREKVDIMTTTFPVHFSVDLFAPPLAKMSVKLGASEIAFAVITAMREGASLGEYQWNHDLTENDDDGPPDLLGVAESHAVVYVKNAIAAGSEGAKVLGGPLGPGFHLMSVVWAKVTLTEYEACIEAWTKTQTPRDGGMINLNDAPCEHPDDITLVQSAKGFDTVVPIQLTDDFDFIQIPNFPVDLASVDPPKGDAFDALFDGSTP